MTGPEIWYQTDDEINMLVGGMGTGGTLTGCAQFLRTIKPNILIIAVEPPASPMQSGGAAGPHQIQGIGAAFVQDKCNQFLLDEVIQITGQDALDTAKMMATMEGLLVGVSSGAAVHAALLVAAWPENKDKNIVTLIPSLGERYMSTALFADLFAEAQNQEPELIKSPYLVAPMLSKYLCTHSVPSMSTLSSGVSSILSDEEATPGGFFNE
jgi:cysteine synthase A